MTDQCFKIECHDANRNLSLTKRKIIEGFYLIQATYSKLNLITHQLNVKDFDPFQPVEKG